MATSSKAYADSEAAHTTRRHGEMINIPVAVKTDDEEKKKAVDRKLKLLSTMRLSDEITANDPEHAESLRRSQSMFMCNDHASLPRSGLYDALVPDDDSGKAPSMRILDFVNGQLEPDQQAILAKLQSDGMINNAAFISGISGSGKSHLQRMCGTPFIGGRVLTKSFRNVMHNTHLSRFLREKKILQDSEATEVHITERKKPELTQMDESRPSFIQPPNGDYNPTDVIVEKARLLYVAGLDKTVDDLYTQVRRDALKFIESVSRDVPLIYRRYAKSVEIAILKALLLPYPELDLPEFWDVSVKARNANKAISNEYLKFYRNEKEPGVFDTRFDNRKASMAQHALVLSLAEEQQTPEILSAFTPAERDAIRKKLHVFHEVPSRLEDNNGQWTETLTLEIEEACKYAFDWLDLKADIVVATIETALRDRFVLHRQPHFVAVEDVGRLGDLDILPFFSMYHSALARICVGDHRQLGVQLYSSQDTNPFYDQMKTSLLSRLSNTGFYVPDLRSLQRFGNEELLDLVRLINEDSSLQMRKSASRDAETDGVRDIQKAIFPQLKAFTATLYLDYPESEQGLRNSGAKNWSNTRTATVSIDYVQKLLTHGIGGLQIVLTSPHSEQTELHGQLLEAAAKDAMGSRAHQLRLVRCSTVDDFMNEESFYHIHDSCSHTAQVFDEIPRVVVLYSRAQVGFTLIGSSTALMNKNNGFNRQHPCKQALRSMVSSQRSVTLSSAYISRVNQFASILRE